MSDDSWDHHRSASDGEAGPSCETAAHPGVPAICHVLHSLSIGGAEVLAARLARRLRGDFRIVFACLDGLGSLGETLRDEGHSVHTLGRHPGFDWNCGRRLAKVLLRERVGLVHSHQYTPFFYSALARLGSFRIPILFTEHGREFPDYPRPKRILVNKLLLRRRDHVVGVGESVRRALIDNEGLPPRRVSVVENGVDQFPYVAEIAHSDRHAARAEMGAGPDDVLVLQVARLDHLKDHATALRAVAEVTRHRADVRLVLVGEGPEEAEIRRMIEGQGLGNHVRLLGLRTDIPRLLKASELALLTSISEGIPLTLIEAMAAARPVVSTHVGGVPAVVIDGRTGILTASGDHRSLAAAILRLAGDPEARRTMGKLGREVAESRFSEDRMIDAYRRLYRQMLLASSPLRHPVDAVC